MNEDYLLSDEDDEFDESSYFEPVEDEDDSEDSDFESSDEPSEGERETDESVYKDVQLDDYEVKLIKAYDIISNIKEGEEGSLEAVLTTVLEHNPSHSSSTTVNYIIREMFNTQGHSRRQNSVYDGNIMTSDDIAGDDEDTEMNERLTQFYQNVINQFVEYLANRDLSTDTVVSRKRKQRHLPAFIILLFFSGLYGYIAHCPSMPKVYQDEIDYAFRKIQEEKEKLVTDLSVRYEDAGRHELAKKVRELGTGFFSYEPKVLQTNAQFRDLGITEKDLEIYREFRPKWVNMSGSVTQEVISSYIRVCENEKKGMFYELKDKTRGDAITDVKVLFMDWAKDRGTEQYEAAKFFMFK